MHAVSDVSLDIKEGETLGLVGESGCGKSTTGKAIMQLPRPNSGKVKFEGDDLTTLSGEDLRRTRTRMKMIFQDPISSLNPRRKVEDIVAEGLRIWQEMDRPAVTALVQPVARRVLRVRGRRRARARRTVRLPASRSSPISRSWNASAFSCLAGFAVMFGLLFRTAGVDLWNVRRTGWTLSLMLWGAALVVNRLHRFRGRRRSRGRR